MAVPEGFFHRAYPLFVGYSRLLRIIRISAVLS